MIWLSALIVLFTSSAETSRPVDYLIVNATLVSSSSLPPGADALVIRGQKIEAVGETRVLRNQFKARKVIDAEKGLVFPGFVNTHTHVTTGLLRGVSGAVDAADWWMRLIWPTEKSYLSRDMSVALASHGIADQLRSGVTTINDMSFFSDAVAEAALKMGVRARVAETLVSESTPSYENLDDALKITQRTMEMAKKNSRLSVAIAPHTIANLAPADFQKIIRFAVEANLPLHMHFGESAMEAKRAQQWAGKSPIEYLKTFKAPAGSVLVHGVLLDEAAIREVKNLGYSMSLNIISNLALAAGQPKINLYRKWQVPLTIGTDGAVTNSSSDYFEELRTVLVSYWSRYKNEPSFSSTEVFGAATFEGAKSLGLGTKTGSLTPGYLADIVIARPVKDRTMNVLSPTDIVVKVLRSSDIKNVFIDGEMVIDKGQFTKKIQQYLDANTLVISKRLPAVRAKLRQQEGEPPWSPN